MVDQAVPDDAGADNCGARSARHVTYGVAGLSSERVPYSSDVAHLSLIGFFHKLGSWVLRKPDQAGVVGEIVCPQVWITVEA